MKQDISGSKNQCLNVFKGIACELVIINHFHGPGIIGDIEYTISHLGVPFFFLISGYYLFDSKLELNIRRIFQKLRHIGLLTIVWVSIYFLDNCYQRYILNGNKFAFEAIISDIKRIFALSTLKSTILWSTGILGKGQWFLIALLQSYTIFAIIVLFHGEKLVIKYCHIIAGLLFIVHIPLRMLLIARGVNSIGNMPLNSTAVVRNAWFDGLAFILVGLSVKTHHNYKHKNCIIIGLLAVACSIAEAFALSKFSFTKDTNYVLYIGTIVAVTEFFIFAISSPQAFDNNILEYIGDKLSLIIYFIHPLAGFYIQYILESNGLQNSTVFNNLEPLIIIIATTIFAFLIHTFIERIRSTTLFTI